MKTSNTRKIPRSHAHHAKTEEQRRADFNDLVRRAAEGDRRAIGAIAIAVSPTLLEEARACLGEFEQDAGEVLQDFFLGLIERRLLFVPAHGRAMSWMCGIVQAIAQQRRRERERDWDIDDE
jgi:hypothetical protein